MWDPTWARETAGERTVIHRVISKYGHVKKSVVGGKKYDSKFEGAYARDLLLRKKAGDIKDFESHVRIPLVVNEYIICDYYIDFVVHHNDGSTEYVETKGIKTRDWVLKWKLFEAIYSGLPDVRLTLVQQKRFKLRRIKKT